MPIPMMRRDWAAILCTNCWWESIRRVSRGWTPNRRCAALRMPWGPRELFLCAEALADTVLARQQRRWKKRVRRITIDVDATDDPTHGQQQLSFFNGHYHHSCYLPLLAFVSFNEEREQFLLAAVLQPGNAAPAGAGLGVVRRIIERV